MGLFKLEEKGEALRDARFVAPKVYYYHKPDGTFKGKFKGVCRGLHLDEELYARTMDVESPATITQAQWTKQFGGVVIRMITKNLITKPRRRVNVDGSTDYYETVE